MSNINLFFEQFSNFSKTGKITLLPNDIDIINSKLSLLLDKLTLVERNFYQSKRTSDPMYADLTDAEFNECATAYDLKSIKVLRSRMQFWAATDTYGATIRNPKAHLLAVKYLDLWDRLHSLSFSDKPYLFFEKENLAASIPSTAASSHNYSN